MDETEYPSWTPPPGAEREAGMAPLPPRRSRLRGKTAAVATLIGLAGGGMVGGYAITQAATATPSPSASSGTSTIPGTPGHDSAPGGIALGGAGDRAEDEQTIAGALGISVSQLESALQGGQTIAAVAKAHNVDVNTVIAAIVAAKDKEIDTALAAGQITQAQATQMKANAQQEATDQVNGTMPAGGHGPGGRGGLQSEDLTLVAGVLGISASQLQTDLQNGQTIAAVAKAQNVDVSRVISAWMASENQEIDARVAAGQLTQAQATQDKQQTQQRVTDMVNGTAPAGGPRGGPPASGPTA